MAKSKPGAGHNSHKHKFKTREHDFENSSALESAEYADGVVSLVFVKSPGQVFDVACTRKQFRELVAEDDGGSPGGYANDELLP